MDHGDGPERHPGAGEVQHDAAARAVPEGGEPVGIGTGLGEQDVERGAADGPHPIGVGDQRQDPGQHRLGVGEPLAAVVLHRQGRVAALGEVVGAAALEVVETDPVVPDQHRRPRPLAVRPRQVADHRQAVGVVGDLARRDHPADASERAAPRGRCSLSAERAASPPGPRRPSPAHGAGAVRPDHHRPSVRGSLTGRRSVRAKSDGSQDEAVSVGVDDGDSPPVPVRVACCHLLAARTDQLIDGLLIDGAADVEHQEVFVGGAGRRLPARVPDQLQVPGRLVPSQHQQGMVALGVGPGPVQHLQPEPVHPEPLGTSEVAAGTGDAEMARWLWAHALSVPHVGRPFR